VIPGLCDPREGSVLCGGFAEVLGPWPEGVTVYARTFRLVPWDAAFDEAGVYSDTRATAHLEGGHL
jgi:hypothetical protein